MSELSTLVRRFRARRILVVGDSLLDSYFHGKATRISPEAPVPVLLAQQREHVPGGAANVAVNVRSLGAPVVFLSVVGHDDNGRLLKKALQEREVSTGHIIEDPDRRTVQKLRLVADGQFVVRFDDGDTGYLSQDTELSFIQQLQASYRWAEAVILSDYRTGIFTPGVLASLERLSREEPRIIIVDSKALHRFSGLQATAMTPNEEEAREAVEHVLASQSRSNGHSPKDLCQVGEALLRQTGSRWVIITRGEDGAALFEAGAAPTHLRPQPVTNPQVIGAGDTFTAALCLALASAAPVKDACELATQAATIAVSKPGTACVTLQELLQAGQIWRQPDVTDLASLAETYRQQGKRIVFTNGCFDIIHRGHIHCLREAKRLGDVLIVGVNTDASVRRLKGPNRPINNEDDRLAVVAGIHGVDHAVLFDEDTPSRLIREIRPDVHVKGGDYRMENLEEASLVRQLGGQTVIVPYVEAHSSTAIINRIADPGQVAEKGGARIANSG